MTTMLLSRQLLGNVDLKKSELVVVIVIVAAEMLLGLICLITGVRVFPLFLGGLLVLLIFLFPRIGVLFVLFFVPGVRYLTFDIGPVTMNPLRLLLVPTFIGLMLHVLVNRASFKPLNIGVPMVAFISVAVLSVVQGCDLGAGLTRLMFFLSLFLVPFVLVQLIDNKKWVKTAVGVMVASSIVLITLALVEAFFVYRGFSAMIAGGHRLAGGVTGRLYGGPHPFALDLNTYLPFVLLLAAASCRWKSLALILLGSCFMLGIFFSGAMAGWLGAIGSLIVLFLVGFARDRRKVVLGVFKRLVLVMVVGGVLVGAFVPTGLRGARLERFMTIVKLQGTHALGSRTTNLRLPVWAAYKKMFYEHPLLGVGLGSGPVEYHKYMVAKLGEPGKEFTHHGFNVFVDIGAEMGILGLAAFVWFIIAYARQVLRSLSLIEDPFLANMLLASFTASVAVFIQMQTETGTFWGNNFWCLLGLSLAIVNVANRKRSKI
ncbi:MAG: O-antigen ligase family protein [Thermodesulfobacteriota bacterium]|nr:O-antigen ligase family protein [Thermodesulfobacteriota bacterium]